MTSSPPSYYASLNFAHSFCIYLLLSNLEAVPKALDNQLLAGTAAVDISHVVGGALKVAAGIVALGDEEVVLGAILNGLVERDWWALSDMLVRIITKR